MIEYENHCCDCAVPGHPCIGDSCRYMNVPVYYCDFCNNKKHAEYVIDGEHYCEFHAKEYLQGVFKDLTVMDQAENLDILIKKLEE